MNSLPLEVLLQIFTHARDISLETLQAVSLVNRACYNAATTLLYSQIVLKFSDATGLKRAVASVTGNKRKLKYVRRLELICIPAEQPQSRESPWGNMSNFERREMKTLDFVPPTIGPFLERHLAESGLPISTHDRRTLYTERDWQPLASLIASIEKLAEFHYVVANIFPTCLLQAIHDHHPACRLNLWIFPGLYHSLHLGRLSFESLRDSDPYPCSDPFDMEVLRSPCLHAIKFFYRSELQELLSDTHTRLRFHQYEILPLIAEAPNIKHIELRQWPALFDGSIVRFPQEWEETVLSAKPPLPLKLESLSFGAGAEDDTGSILLRWSRVMDLSCLRSLDLGFLSFPAEMRGAVSRLRNLERLFINDTRFPMESFGEELKLLLDSLNPLKYLCIRNLNDVSLLNDILPRHGPSLQGLMIQTTHQYSVPNESDTWNIFPTFSHIDILHLANHCPHLEELRIPLQRSKGDHQECQLYRALGRLPKLRSLILDLNYTPTISLMSQGDVDDDGYPYDSARLAELEDALINASMDESLAMSIWDMISSSQKTRQLRDLRCGTFAECYMAPIRYVLDQRTRSFLITRRGFVRTDDPEIMETGKEKKRVMQGELANHYGESFPYPPHIPEEIFQVIHSLWPTVENYRHSRDDWAAFPLQG